MLCIQLGGNTAQLKPEHWIASLYQRQNEADFAKILDDTLVDIAALNADVFSVANDEGEKIVLFERITDYVSSKRNEFARALINKLVHFSFEQIFAEKFDFFATLFEYLIKDYNKDGGGKYAEYYTPHAVAKIMAACLVTDERSNVSCYDPSSGSGTLLMNLAHAIGEEKCSLYSQDISQKSSHLLRLNLILNNLVHSIPNIIQGNTILHPDHKADDGSLKQFDYIVSNPPFKLDFSDFRDELDTKANNTRFFAGIPNVPAKKKESMAIYLLFIQHIVASLNKNGSSTPNVKAGLPAHQSESEKAGLPAPSGKAGLPAHGVQAGKAAIVVPTGFITAQSGIDKKIRQHLVENKMLAGVVSMPSNIFATTGTNVSILFLDTSNKGEVILIDASKLGTKVKDGKNQKTLLSTAEEDRIIETFNAKEAVDDFSVAVSYDDITAKNYSLSAGQYFEVKIEYMDITPEEFQAKLAGHQEQLAELFAESNKLETLIQEQLGKVQL